MTEDSHGCGDWIPYKDEKCFKVFERISINSDANHICRKLGSKLAIIRTEEEQHFIKEYLKSKKIVDSVWIGMTRNFHSFLWNDGTEMKYTDWLSGRPAYKADTDCAVISLDFDDQLDYDLGDYGKWFDVSCFKSNLPLCEKIQPWSMINLQKELMGIRRNHSAESIKQKNLIKSIKRELDDLKSITIPQKMKELDTLKSIVIPEQKRLIESQNNEINILKSNPVPIGFVYVELKGQKWPSLLWPNTQWDIISSSYAGLFFRIEGGHAPPFDGQIQEDQTQSLDFQPAHWCDDGADCLNNWAGFQRIKGWSNEKLFFTGADEGRGGGSRRVGIKMKHNNEEVRPRNQAIRLWRRTG